MIYDLELAFLWRKNNPNVKITVTNGCFDIIHAGHIHSLKEASSFGNILVVGLNSDHSIRLLKGETRPINNQENRKIVLESLRYVSNVFIYDSIEATEFLKVIKPDIYVKSSDYSIDTMNKSELEVLRSLNSKIYFVSMIPNLSTTNITKKL